MTDSRFFFPQAAFHRQAVEQGLNEWINYPETDPDVPGLFAARATIKPGMGHDFHRHPGREELIYLLSGTIEQWVRRERRVLTAGDAVLIPAGWEHASFNDGTSDAVLFVALSPAVSDEPLAEDLSDQVPWNTLRP